MYLSNSHQISYSQKQDLYGHTEQFLNILELYQSDDLAQKCQLLSSSEVFNR